MKSSSLVIVTLTSAFGLAIACSDAGIVGGECRSGFVERAGECVESSSLDGGAGFGGHAGNGGAAADSGLAGRSGDSGMHGKDASRDAREDVEDGGSETDGGRSDGGASEGGTTDGGGCVPPYDTPAHCGDCETACPGNAPICALMDGEYQCIPMCTDPLVQCGNECVDTNSDPNHCGSCFNACPSGICQAGQCVGATTGHVVVACMSYDKAQPGAAQTTVLGNAVFLPLKNPVRILGYAQYAHKSTQTKLDQSIGWAAQAKGRTYDLVHATSSAEVVADLNVINYDVFVVYDQALAPAGTLAKHGSAWYSTLDSFVKAGGIVFVSSGGQHADMGELISNAGLLPVTGFSSITGSTAHNVAPADAIGVNVISPFLALEESCTFTTTEAPSANTIYVVTDSNVPGTGAPVVVHRVP